MSKVEDNSLFNLKLEKQIILWESIGSYYIFYKLWHIVMA